MIREESARYVGTLVVLVPAHPASIVRHEGAVLVAVYSQGLLFCTGRGIRIWVSWVDLRAGHCRLEGTPDAAALMALAQRYPDWDRPA